MTRPPMRAKSLRVSDALWAEAQAKADERGDVLSEVIRTALRKYIARKPPQTLSPPPASRAP